MRRRASRRTTWRRSRPLGRGGAAAGRLYEVVGGQAPPAEVMAPTERRVKGVRVRSARTLDRRDCTDSWIKHRVTPEQVEAALRRNPAAKGAAKLGRVLRGDTKLLLSKLEKGFIRLLKRHKLALPETNINVEGNTRHAWE